jgi:OmpA-OmpF porin, OOP family
VKLVRLLAVVTAVALAQATSAQSFELERLQLDPGAAGSLVVGTGEVLPQGSFRLAAAGDWQHNPLVVADGRLYGRRDGASVVEDRQTLRLTVDYVVSRGVEVYARVNYVLNQEGESGLEPAESDGFGMPSIGLRIAALRQGVGGEGGPLNAAIAVEFLPPWGTEGAIAKFSNPGALLKLELGRTMGHVVVGGEVGVLARESIRVGDQIVGSEAVYGVALALKGAIRPELSFRGAVPFEEGDPGYAELLAGLRANVGPVEVFALGGPGFFNAIGTPEWRGVVGLAFAREGSDAKPAEEAKPAPARGPPPPPPPPVDPCAPGQAHTPEQCPALDDDGDGIANGRDACPRERGIPETKGCPAKDQDGDGVADHLDKCPSEAGAADNGGCPRVVVEERKVELREQVLFELGKAEIRPESGSLLDEIANVMKEHPEITQVLVEGHTDATGSPAVNNRLSQARADAVVNALVERGVEKARLAAKGFGSSRPIQSNDTLEGRDANRRVEISITQSE